MDMDTFQSIRNQLKSWAMKLSSADSEEVDILAISRIFRIDNGSPQDVAAVLGALLSSSSLKKSYVTACVKKANRIRRKFTKSSNDKKTIIDRWLAQKNSIKRSKQKIIN